MIFPDAFLNYYVVFDLRLALDFCEVIVDLGSHALTTGLFQAAYVTNYHLIGNLELVI